MQKTLFTIILLAISAMARAGSVTGEITAYHLNSISTSRGVCVTTVPAIPGTGWACLYKDNSLYKEITATLLAARMAGMSCAVTWNTTDADGHALITFVQC
jgi:hypothetical protein